VPLAQSSQQVKRRKTDKSISPAKQPIKKINVNQQVTVGHGNTTIPTHNHTLSKHARNVTSDMNSLTDRVPFKR